jgi:hypothetical protein
MNRRRFVKNSAAFGAGMLLPLPATSQTPWGTVHELTGRVLLNGRPMSRDSAIRPGQTITTESDGHIWFTLAGDAFFLRPGSELRLSPSVRDSLIEALRLVTGALGATFRRGADRNIFAQTVTIGIRGTGIYVQTAPDATYVCTCFGATELSRLSAGDTTRVSATHHAGRVIQRGDSAIQEAEMSLMPHTDEEMSRLERLAGRPYPF